MVYFLLVLRWSVSDNGTLIRSKLRPKNIETNGLNSNKQIKETLYFDYVPGGCNYGKINGTKYSRIEQVKFVKDTL